MKIPSIHELRQEKLKIVTIFVYTFVLLTSSLSTISVIFPALFPTLALNLETEIDKFELGSFAIPVIIANVVVLIFSILYYKQIIPNTLKDSLNYLRNFDVSKKVAIILLVILMSFFIMLNIDELFLNEQNQWGDFFRIRMVMEGWPFSNQGDVSVKHLHVKNFFLKTSETLFQNIKIIPFIGTNALLLVTYLFTEQLTKKRFSGIIAVLITLTSFSFWRYDTLATYANFWTLFFLLSLYLMNTRKWIFSPISYICSILSKALTVSFIPLSFFFIYNSEMKRKKKLRLTTLYIIIVLLLIGALFLGVDPGGDINVKSAQTFNFSEFLIGFSAWTYQLRFDYIALMFYLPLTATLILISKSKIKNIDSVLVLMAGTLFAAPLLSGFTGFNIFPYRYIPFIVFFSIGVGSLLSRRIN